MTREQLTQQLADDPEFLIWLSELEPEEQQEYREGRFAPLFSHNQARPTLQKLLGGDL